MSETSLTCDFCGVPVPAGTGRWYPCDTFQVSGSNYVSVSAWVACSACGAFVDTGNRAALLARATRRLCAAELGRWDEHVACGVRRAHAGFWLHRLPLN